MTHTPDPFRKRRPRAPLGRYDAEGDPALEFPVPGKDVEFRFDAALAKRLLRREVNAKEAFTVKDAAGAFWRASVKELSETGGAAVAYERCKSPEPAIELTLACAVLARQRMIFVAQKATELGVSRIVPLLTERSVLASGLEHEKAHAWPGQILRAAKQCRRSSLPELTPPMALDAFLACDLSKVELSLYLDNVEGQAAAFPSEPKRVLLLVGPEGGFSPVERRRLAGRAQPWLLGGRVLRAETAVLAGLTAVQLRWGDFRPGGS